MFIYKKGGALAPSFFVFYNIVYFIKCYKIFISFRIEKLFFILYNITLKNKNRRQL